MNKQERSFDLYVYTNLLHNSNSFLSYLIYNYYFIIPKYVSLKYF